MSRFLSILAAAAAAAVLAWAPGTRSASAADAPAEVLLTIENHAFSQPEVRVKAGAPFVLVVTNKDGAAEEFESRDLRIEKVVPAGKTIRIRVPALKAGSYAFAGEYHERTARGRIVAE